MKIYLAADHAGFELKEALVPFLRDELHFEVEDCGARELDPHDDYPDIIGCAAGHVSEDVGAGVESRAIILGKSGQGEAMVANRFPGVRAAVYYGPPSHKASDGRVALDVIRLSREHNDSNVLSLGAGFLSIEEAKEAVRIWSETEFSGEERHRFRNEKIDEIAADVCLVEEEETK